MEYNESQNQQQPQKKTQEVPAQPQRAAITCFNFFDPNQYEVMKKYCKLFALSDLVPDSYKITNSESEPKAIANCMIALDIAMRINTSPLMVMQNMVPIYGKPSWSSKFLIATINACGRFKPIKYKRENKGKLGMVEYTSYETTWKTDPNTGRKYKDSITKQAQFDGSQIDNIQYTAYTTENDGEDILLGTPVDLEMAIKEGWYTKTGSKWRTMPEKMLKYRAASFWANEYAPELSMGIYTREEVEDIETVDAEAVVVSTSYERMKVDVPTAQPPKQPQPVQPSQQQSSKTIEDCGY